MEQAERNTVSPEEKRKQLFLSQKKTLDVFLSRGTITKAQYDKSFGDLMLKMCLNSQGEPVR